MAVDEEKDGMVQIDAANETSGSSSAASSSSPKNLNKEISPSNSNAFQSTLDPSGLQSLADNSLVE